MDWKVPASTVERAKNTDIAELIGAYIPLTKVGKEFQALCPFHGEKTPSFTVVPDKNIFHCFGCGTGGDPIDFVQKFESLDFPEAVQRIVGDVPANDAAPVQRPSLKVAAPSEWEPISPVPDDCELVPRDIFNRRKGDSFERLTASGRWAYHDANGQLLGYTCRFELPGGGKDVIPQTLHVNVKTGEMAWRWLSFGKPRPLYGLDKLAQHPGAQVIVVEGEKTSDAAQARYEAIGIPRTKLVTVAWPGGANGVKHVDWAALAGRHVGLWPDADQKDYPEKHALAGQRMPFLAQPGTMAMLDIAARLDGMAKAVKFIMPPDGVPDGWDLADDLPDGFDLLAHTKAAALPMVEFHARHAGLPPQASVPDPEPDAGLPPWEGEPAPEAPVAALPAAPAGRDASGEDEHDSALLNNGYFTILGYDRSEYFFFQHEKRQVLTYRKGDFTDTGLTELAPVNWWEEFFPASKEGIDRKAAINWVFRTANGRGIYDPTRVRGRGSWMDKGRHVFHHGDVLTVDGAPVALTNIRSAYVYQMERKMPTPAAEPLTEEEGAQLVRVAELIRWSMPGSAALFAGFAMLAPICGAMPWRPHIWLTGGAGTGKSTIQNKYLGSLLREMSVYATGDSSEPGIRQELQADAIPVLIDEAESNNDGDKQRIEKIIGMIRKTSTESQAKTLKGTLSGEGQRFHIRSMFCLASINVNMPGKADIDRLTKLTLRPPQPGGQEHWDKLEAELNKIEADETIASRLLARALKMMPVILDSVGVFRRAAAKHFGTQRQGDQFGILLAGCWCLQNSHAPTEDEAGDMVRRYNWSEHIEDAEQDDARAALGAVLGAKLRVGHQGEFTIYELIRETSTEHRHDVVERQVADDALRRHGIRVESTAGELWFGTSVLNLTKLVSGMSFVTDLRGQLLRIQGAKRLPTVKKFNGHDSKCVSVPLGPILGDLPAGGDDGDDEIPI